MLQTAEVENFLRAELAPKPGRLGDALRITVLTVLVVIISETYQIPLTAYSAYIVFFVSKEEAASTVLTGLLFTVATTLSVIEALAVYMISTDEPGLRLPLMAVVVLIGMFLSRASPLGPVAFGTGFLATLSLTLIDSIPPDASMSGANMLTRLVLWIWIVAMLPISLVVIGNILTGRDPFKLFKGALSERLRISGEFLRGSIPRETARARISVLLGEGTASLLKNLKMAVIFNKKLKEEKAIDRRRALQTGRLLILLKEWDGLAGVAEELGGFYLSLANSSSSEKVLAPVAIEGKASLLISRIRELAERFEESRVETAEPEEKPQHSLLFPDAFSNPDYFRYALKTTLAIFTTYITYNLLDWPGIRTCMITCFFVTLGSFGETAQKMTLRIVGALIGGGLGLAAVVFVMPYLTTITGLCLLIAAVAFPAAWIACSSERLSYAGLQIALAFLFSTIVGYGPSIELSEARDRVVGILFGNVVVYVVFANIWPVSVSEQAARHIGVALGQLSRLFSGMAIDETLLGLEGALSQARRYVLLNPFEPKPVRERGVLEVDTRLIEAIEALRGPALVLAERPEAAQAYHRSLSQWLSGIQGQVVSTRAILSPPSALSLIQVLESAATPESLAYADWYRTLDKRVHEFEAVSRNALALQAITYAPEMRGAA